MKNTNFAVLFALLVTILSPVLGQTFDPNKIMMETILYNQPQDQIGIETADLDGDLIEDQVTWTGSSQPSACANIYIYYGKGTRDSFPYQPSNYYFSAGGLKLGDLNGDGYKEIVIGFDDSIKIYWNSASKGFSPNIFTALRSGNGVNWLGIGDVDHDYIMDIAIPHIWEDSLSVFFGLGGGKFGLKKYHYYSGGSWDKAIVSKEFLYLKGFQEITAWRFNVKREIDTTFVVVSIPILPGGYFDIDVSDQNNDLHEDVLFSSFEDNGKSYAGVVYGPKFVTQKKLMIGPITNNGVLTSIRGKDLNCDGTDEVVGLSQDIFIFGNNFSNLVDQLDGLNYYSQWPSCLAIGDRNGDDAPEIFSTSTGGTYYYQNTSPGCTTGVIEKKLENIKIFPNPANEIINISFTGGEVDLISIFDTYGRIVYQGNSGNVNISALKSGVYYVKSCKSQTGVRFVKK